MDDKQQQIENFRSEYSALISYHNSIVTHRFTLLGFFIAAIGIIASKDVKFMEALLILFITLSLYIVERRNRVLYTQMSIKGTLVLKQLHIFW
jgi:hypothetical protein